MTNSSPPERESTADTSRSYRLARALGRFWLRFVYRKLRRLGGEVLPATGPVLLVLNGAANFVHALALVVAFDRPLRFVLDQDQCQGFWRRHLAAWLGTIVHEPSESLDPSADRVALEMLARGEAVAVFAEPEIARSEALSPSCHRAARLAVEAESSSRDGRRLMLLPLYLLDTTRPGRPADLLIHNGRPLRVSESLSGGPGDASVRRLAGELEDRLKDDPFRLQQRDVQFFLADLEDILRADLEEDWASLPNWKQTTEGFELSRFIAECIEQLNALHPSRLIGLRIALEQYREEHRRWSLRQAEVEAAGDWARSELGRAWYWVESVLGFPIALYGFINHLVIVGVLSWRGLLHKIGNQDSRHVWLLRALVVLGFYVGQVALCAHWWGRAAAGYYTLTLPVSGAFVWHYHWLMKTRMRVVYLASRLPRQGERLRRMRKAFLDELNNVRDAYAATLSLKH